MQHDFLPVVIRYDGMDADGHVIDLGLLGQSIQGASKLLGSAGSIVMTGQFAKKTKSMSVRVLAGQPEAHCWEIPAIITTVLVPAVAPMFPIIKEAATAAATKAVTAIVNYAISTVAGRTKEADMSRDIAIKFLEEMGHTPRTAIEAMERLATSQRPAIRMFVAPVGQSCSSARIGDPAFGSVTIDASMREAIDAPEEVEITDAQDFEILISEFDFRNRSCKLSMRDHIDDRITGEITDPIAQVAKNPYSTALDNQRWLCVRGKAQLKAGELEKLYISDLAPRSLPAPSIGG
ncbi:hypothetical protein FNL55_20365 [Tardiphaga sp. vice352]|uniref:DUF7946 domain-containing protein n=1 Tax=unclassified Tardiphaga TaxID=2631404 RepID=UPI001165855F|nr:MULTISPECIES: hypothetical protein [unclassified Tardiphaga]QDM28297.1 hypothetical protein FNL56_20880 [Tardiphaga sp. vice304]QDM33436.1 hypothetical protein FNL55_20365 [Tardiphaga sp. vice352]